jgi:hypothetical protein
MKEETYRFWDVIAKFVAPVLTVTGILVGLYQFSSDQDRQRAQVAANERLNREQLAENDRLNYKRRVWEKQMEVYSKISTVVGRIAASRYKNDKTKFDKDIAEFDILYWGEFIYVKDETVEQAIKDFHLETVDFKKGNTDEIQLINRAVELIEALRKSTKETESKELNIKP